MIAHLRDYCHSIDVIRLRPQWSKVKSLLHLFSSKPMTLPYFYSRRLQDLVRRRLQEEKINVIVVFSSCMAQFVPHDVAVYKIIDFADVDSDKWFQYAKHVKFPFSMIYQLEGQRLRKYEISLASRYDCCTVVSQVEEHLFRSYSDRFILSTVPNGVDLEYFQPREREPDQPLMIFMGVM
ncbi:sugar transferase, partial [bacterium]|nr:sugar transferase [bacterium]